MENAVENVTQKKAEKKTARRDKDVRVGGMCWASGEVRRGHTSYDSLRRVTAIRFQVSHTPQDLLRRAADFNAYGSCRPPLVIWDFVVFLNIL